MGGSRTWPKKQTLISMETFPYLKDNLYIT